MLLAPMTTVKKSMLLTLERFVVSIGQKIKGHLLNVTQAAKKKRQGGLPFSTTVYPNEYFF